MEGDEANKGVKEKQMAVREPAVLKNLSKVDVWINCKEKDKNCHGDSLL